MDELAERERRKYERMWAVPNYSKTSPGLNIAPVAFRELGMAPGESLIDFGCGECRAIDWFLAQGVFCTGIDIVPLRPGVIGACLWDLPDIGAGDYGFSSDVMEHIPTEKVDDVLAGIRRASRKGAFLQIATRPDKMGRLIGETLHLTVRTEDWWVAKLREHWASVRTGRGDIDWQFWAACF